jgi:acyl-CoA synthetase (NDP forming)
VGFITHSGSVFSAIAKNTRDLRMNYCVSTGLELVTTAADYLRFLIDQPSTRVVGMFLETVRDPEGFLASLREADRRGIAVVVLKVGRSMRGSQLALAHSGATAGSHSAYRAVFEAHNVVEVQSLDEMVDTLELFAAGRTPSTASLAAVTDSGGERALLVDLASELGVVFADPTPATVDALREHLDPSLEPANPADLWGSGHDWQRSYDRCIAALVADPGVGAFAYAIDFNVGSRLTGDYLDLAIRHAASTDKPFAVVGNISAGLDPTSAATLRAAGVPVLHGAENGLRALQHLLRHAERRRQPSETSEVGPPSDIREDLLALLQTEDALTEQDSLTMLARLGIPVVASSIVGDEEELRAALATTAFPVVLKTAAAGIAHKTETGGVVTGIATVEGAVEAYRDLAGRLGPEATLQRQVDLSQGDRALPGHGRRRAVRPDRDLGAGGPWVETLRDTGLASAAVLASVRPRRHRAAPGLAAANRGPEPPACGSRPAGGRACRVR